jgi:hypothetical protein
MDRGLERTLRRLAERRVPYAEIWRAVGLAADERAVTRLSYTHVRALVRLERIAIAERRARREFWVDVAGDLARGLVARPVFRVLEHKRRLGDLPP